MESTILENGTGVKETQHKRRKNISVGVKTYGDIKSLGEYGDTLEDIINKCIAAYRKLKEVE